MMDKLRDDFANPALDLRGAPFWSWNDRLEPEELARQARDMKAHGMGGFFMHSRDGLETVYMGPEWRDMHPRDGARGRAGGHGRLAVRRGPLALRCGRRPGACARRRCLPRQGLTMEKACA